MNKTVNRKAVALLAAAALLLTMLPVTLLWTAASSAADALLSGLKKTVVQDLTVDSGFEPWGANVWYNAEFTDTPAVGKNGLYFSDLEKSVAHGTATIRINKLQTTDISDGKYLAVTFGKNGLAAGDIIRLRFEFGLGNDYVLANGTEVLYDNGSTELQKATAAGADAFSREVSLTVGAADLITAFIPVEKIVFAYGDGKASDEALAGVQYIHFAFTDLGNKDKAELANRDAVSIKEIALYSAMTAGDKLVDGLKKTVVRDLRTDPVESIGPWSDDVWYNDSFTDAVARSAAKGAYFTADAHHGTANIKIGRLLTADISGGTYLAVTFGKNGLPVGSAVKVRFGFSLDSDYVLANGTEVLYDNGSTELQKATAAGADAFSREVSLTVGAGSTITAYLPVEKIVFAYGDGKASAAALAAFAQLGLELTDLGNKDTAELSNQNAVSIKALALYSAPTAGEEFAGGMDKTVVRDLRTDPVESIGPWSDDVWYNDSFTDAVARSAAKGAYFTADAHHGTANIKIGRLLTADISGGTYLAVTFGKNGLPVGSAVKVRFGFSLDSDYVLANGTEVLYDNGSTELQKATAAGADAFSREVSLTVGAGSTITVYLPVEKIVNAYSDSKASAAALAAFAQLGLEFTDLGNKDNADLPNQNAVSIRSIELFTERDDPDPEPPTSDDPDDGKVTPDDATPAGDQLVKGQSKTVLQDFKTKLTAGTSWPGDFHAPGCGLWYNPDVTGKPLFGSDRGLCFGETGAHGKAKVLLFDLSTHDLSDARYLTVTLRKNRLTGPIKLAVGMTMNVEDFVLSDGATVYYDNGSAELQTCTATGSDAFSRYLTVAPGPANVIRLYIPMSSFVNGWTNLPYTDALIADVTSIGLTFDDLGNANDDSLKNVDAVSVREIAAYSGGADPSDPDGGAGEPDDATAAGDKLTEKYDKTVIRDLREKIGVGMAWPADFNQPVGSELWYNPDLTNKPLFGSARGLTFSNVSNDQSGQPMTAHGKAKIVLFKLDQTDLSAAQYLTVTFRKNQITEAFRFAMTVTMMGAEEFELKSGAEILYDNGSAELQKATVEAGARYSHFISLTPGSANVIKMFIPFDALVHAYKNVEADESWRERVTSIGFEFTDLGNLNDEEIKNVDAVSIREIAAYTFDPGSGGEGGGREEAGPVASGDELIRGLLPFVDQDFSAFDDKDVTVKGSATVSYDKDKGLHFNNDGKAGAMTIGGFKTYDFTSAKYIAITFGKNGVPEQFRTKIAFGKLTTRFGDYQLGLYHDTSARVYYDNGDGLRTAYPGVDDMFTFKVGSADTVTVYVPTQYLQSRRMQIGEPCAVRQIDQEDLANIRDAALTFGDIGNKDNDVENSDAVSVKSIVSYMDDTDDITLPSERLLLQDFTNVDIDKIYNASGKPITPVVKGGELTLQGEKGHVDLTIADLMARNVTGIEYIAVTVRFKQAVSVNLGIQFACETGVYGTGDDKNHVKPYYVDDGFRVRRANTWNSWAGPTIPRPFSSDTVTLYLPLTSINNGTDGVEGLGKTLLKYVQVSTGWARSVDLISNEDVADPPYQWALEDSFAITRIEAVGTNFKKATERTVSADEKVIYDFTKVDPEDLEYDLDNAEAYVRPTVRNGALWFDDLMGKFTPEMFVIDMYNDDLTTTDMRGADYLALKIRGGSKSGTTYAMLSIEDNDLRPFDYNGTEAYVLAEDGKIYALPADGRVGIDHALYGQDVTLLLPLDEFGLSIYYFGSDFSPLDLSDVGTVRMSLYGGSYFSPAGVRAISLMSAKSGSSGDNGNNGDNSGDKPAPSPVTGVAVAALPAAAALLGAAGVLIARKRRRAD